MFESVVCQYWNIPAYCDKTASELSFSTQANLSKIELLSNCLYFPVHNAKFSDGEWPTSTFKLSLIPCLFTRFNLDHVLPVKLHVAIFQNHLRD
jgi:hypothetical protein